MKQRFSQKQESWTMEPPKNIWLIDKWFFLPNPNAKTPKRQKDQNFLIVFHTKSLLQFSSLSFSNPHFYKTLILSSSKPRTPRHIPSSLTFFPFLCFNFC